MRTPLAVAAPGRKNTMKLFLAQLVLFLTAGAAAAQASDWHGDRFDVSCRFESTGCEASAQIYKSLRSDDETLQPVLENRLQLRCGGAQTYDGAVAVLRKSLESGVRW